MTTAQRQTISKFENPQEALHTFQQAIEEGNIAAHVNLGVLYFNELGDHQKAIEHLEIANHR